MNQNLIQQSHEAIRRILFLIPQPAIAQIEITNRCNFNCLMCQREDLKVPIKDMDFDLYFQVLKKLAGIKEVILTGWGEPLMHPKLFEMIEIAKQKGKAVSLTSNGSLLTNSIAQKLIKSGLDSISFSIDEVVSDKNSLAHRVTRQIQNIESFMSLLKKEKVRPEVVIQTTLHKNKENEIIKVVKWASSIGADLINVNRLDMRFNKNLKRPDYFEEKKFVKKLEQAAEKYKIRIDFRPHVAFSGFVRETYKLLLPLLCQGGKHCLRVYNYIYINNVGDVTPCCGLPLWSVGNILKDDLRKIWRGPKFNQFRTSDFQRKVCAGCDVLETAQQLGK